MKITMKNNLLRSKKNCLRLLCLATLVFCVGTTAFSQVTLDVKDKPIRQILKMIEKSTEYKFFYNDDFSALNTKTSINVNNVPVDHALKIIFNGSGISWKKKSDNLIVLTPSKVIEKESAPATGGQKRISGTVIDANTGETLPGVNIVIEGLKTGVISDLDGKFSLEVPSSSSMLVFSFVGYENQRVAANKTNPLKVTLSPDIKKLDEVVVVGYGTMKKSDLTGSVSSISSDHFQIGSGLTAQQIMKGSISGVNISQNSGKPGGSNTIRVRGGTSISASNEPLYVIDGVPISTSAGVSSSKLSSTTDYFDEEAVDPLSSLNPNDIESINILKDASSTAIYGSRGANGVVMITTKRGKAGKTQIDYVFNTGISKASKQLDVLTGDEYRAIVNKLGLTLDDKGDNANWQDRIERTAISTSHFLSMTSGSEKSNYRVSLGYSDQQGVIKASDVTNFNSRINLTHLELDGKLKVDVNMSYGQQITNQAPVSNTVGSEMGSCILYEAYVFNPTYPVRDASGSYYNVAPYRVNPVSYTTDILDKRTSTKFLGNISASYNFVKPFTFQVNGGYNSNVVDRNSYISKSNLLGNGYNGYVSMQKLDNYSKLLETILKYNQKFGKHGIDAMAGYSYQYFFDEGGLESASGFVSDEFKWYKINAATTIYIPTSYAQCNKLISMYGRANYNYDDRYLLTATLRRDGSSRFGSNNKWGLFPSAAFSWRVSQEKFYKSDLLSDLKVRASYGVTGSQEIGNYQSMNTLGANGSYYIVGSSKVTVIMPQQYSNPDLKWEQTAQSDIGIDFGLFKGRIQGNLDWYYKKTSDLLLSVDVPSPSYISTQIANVGSVRNTGVELTLNSDLIRSKNFGWSANVNVSHNSNKVLSLSNDKWVGKNIQFAPCQGQGLSGSYSQLITPGQPLGTFYGKKFIGFDSNGMEQYANNGTSQVIGCAQPDLSYGFGTNLSYKNWSLSMNFHGTIGNDIYNCTRNNQAYLSNLPGRNVFEEAVTSGVSRSQAKVYSSRFIEDGSFLRMDNLTIGYDFNIKKTFLSHARAYVTAQNLFCLTHYTGLDPEVNSEISSTGTAPLGVDYLSYPKARTYSLGINVSF
ncbi:MAG: outer membrane protein SusC, starch binding [Bacteroidetes bacterium]|nr:outer membrane protein SusC, starch binding [Bacteroidota bacterium]